MYSKSKGIHMHEYSLTPPPGYDGSRFRRRSDGRDDAFPIYPDQPQIYRQPSKAPKALQPEYCPDEEEAICCEDEECPCEKECDPPCPSHPKKDKGDSGLISFIEGLKSEELLLIALIVLLCTKDGGQGLDTVLILALLLCM